MGAFIPPGRLGAGGGYAGGLPSGGGQVISGPGEIPPPQVVDQLQGIAPGLVGAPVMAPKRAPQRPPAGVTPAHPPQAAPRRRPRRLGRGQGDGVGVALPRVPTRRMGGGGVMSGG